MTASVATNGARLWDSLMAMAEIGALPGGGCGRLALSDEDKAGRDLFVSWCKDAGCTIELDDMGNIFARRAGRDGARPPVATGSHLDTQPHGGRFDGILGVLAGLEVIRSLNDAGIETEAPVEAVVWTNEEGARFAPAMVASGVYAGVFAKDFAYARADADGRTLGEELARIGYKGDKPCGEHPFQALLELHIEQGPILEREGIPVGVVTGAQGLRWYDVAVRGADSHAGSTPMNARRDAMAAAAEMVAAVERLALDTPPNGAATVGQLVVSPNSRNTIPGRVDLTVDLRNPDDATLARMDAALREGFAAIAERRAVAVEIDEIWHNPPVVFDAGCVAAVRRAAENVGAGAMNIVSGAGHDACMVARTTPVGMIFIPCAGGVSHNETESAEPEHVALGCDVLARAMVDLAGRA